MIFENLTINRVITHEVFPRDNERNLVTPTYGTNLIDLNQQALDAFCSRIMDAMGKASRALEMTISNAQEQSVCALAKSLINYDDNLFIQESRLIADSLASAQKSRGLPGGILVVFSGSAGHPSKRILGVIKAETHSGFTRQTGENGSISLQFLTNLLLTPQTKLYKIGIFVESDPLTEAPLPNGWRAFIYDDQISASNKLSAAQYFYDSFLGCSFPETSAKLTREFHNHTKDFIKHLDVSEESKTDLYNALITYLKVDQSPTVQTSVFAQTFIQDAETRDAYAEFMNTKNFPAIAIHKDLTDVASILRYRKVSFSNEIKLIAPAEKFENMIQMQSFEGDPDDNGQTPTWTRIIIKDRVRGQE